MKTRTLLAFAATLGLLLTSFASAQYLSFDGTGTQAGSANGNGWLNIGREFAVYNTINVTDLGVFDFGGGPLALSHDVTLFSVSKIGTGATITPVPGGSVNIPAGTVATDGSYAFASLATPVTLNPGYYAVVSYGMDGPAGSHKDPYGEGNTNLAPNPYHGMMASGIYTQSMYNFTTDTTPTFPNTNFGGTQFQVSSFHYTSTPQTSVYNGSSVISKAGEVSGPSNGPLNIGHEFTLANSINLTELGFWDANGDGLTNSHKVAIYSLDKTGEGATPTLLGTVTVAAGTDASLDAGFRFGALDQPLTLTPGKYAVIGFGFDVQGGVVGDAYGDGGMVPDPASGIANVYNPFQFVDNQDPATAFPTGNHGDNFAVTSFHYTAVPEPAMIALLLTFGAAGLLVVRRKR
jgi:hypothetical protein